MYSIYRLTKIYIINYHPISKCKTSLYSYVAQNGSRAHKHSELSGKATAPKGNSRDLASVERGLGPFFGLKFRPSVASGNFYDENLGRFRYA